MRIVESQNISVENVEINSINHDGLYIGYNWGDTSEPAIITKNIHVVDCHIHGVGRNGISIASGDDLVIERCLIHDINTYQPKSCISVEPESASTSKTLNVNNIRISDCTFRNAEKGVVLGEFEFNYALGFVKVSNCLFDNATFVSTATKASGGISFTLEGNTFINGTQPFFIRLYTPSPDTEKYIINNTFGGSSSNSKQGLIIYDVRTADRASGNITIDGIYSDDTNFTFSLYFVKSSQLGDLTTKMSDVRVYNDATGLYTYFMDSVVDFETLAIDNTVKLYPFDIPAVIGWRKVALLGNTGTNQSIRFNLRRNHVGYRGETITFEVNLAESEYLITDATYYGVQGISKVGIALIGVNYYLVMYYIYEARNTYDLFFDRETTRVRYSYGEIDSQYIVLEKSITKKS